MPDTPGAGPGRWRRLRARFGPPASRLGLWLAVAAGLAAASGQAPLNLWPVAILGFALLAWLYDRAPDLRSAAWTGWAAGTAYFAAALSWIVEPFLVDIARHGWMAPFALILMAGGLALFWAAAFALAQALAPRGAMRLPAWVAAFTLAEMLRGVVFTGFPWALVGHALIPSPLIQAAAWVGPDGLTLLVLSFAALLAVIPRAPLPAAPVALLVGAGLLWSAPMMASRPPATPPDAPVLRLMQPNASQREKWDPRMIPVFLDRMLAYSSEPPVPAVAIWPETSVPAWLDENSALLPVIAGQAQGALSVIGIQRGEGERVFNTLAVLNPDGGIRDVYDKHHLVPFGEYMPLGDLFDRVGISALAARRGNGYTPGPGPHLIDLGAAGKALPLICYEAVFPRDVAAAPERPDLLLQITNDAWFGTFSGPYQHLAQARLRAVEQGLPMIRVANTGVSAVIDATGQVLGSIPLGQAGYLDMARPSAAGPTLYARIGGWPVTILVIVMLLVALGHQSARFRKNSH
ncbi:apolipoprotein N-acyltransferase [Pseudooceanicola sp. 216_PA32_1]|uniref:Apolipoprotein N-acyltransferase n=1 Tax=Pseudooceanicola pacificus TaxID=2676438 RepID=A0A844WDG5_9RHOB|nr:apolipoprotein N-acyltransferase [Pseudooceanicola pacificus]MWB79218.1 apolipoprotein N-acyltransferase [Pseudooceanicola pacificus]